MERGLGKNLPCSRDTTVVPRDGLTCNSHVCVSDRKVDFRIGEYHSTLNIDHFGSLDLVHIDHFGRIPQVFPFRIGQVFLSIQLGFFSERLLWCG